MTYSLEGMGTLRYSLFDVCKVDAEYNMGEVLDEEIKLAKGMVASDDHVIYALLGGAYPTVAAILAHEINFLVS